jgi:hypothetical protein
MLPDPFVTFVIAGITAFLSGAGTWLGVRSKERASAREDVDKAHDQLVDTLKQTVDAQIQSINRMQAELVAERGKTSRLEERVHDLERRLLEVMLEEADTVKKKEIK